MDHPTGPEIDTVLVSGDGVWPASRTSEENIVCSVDTFAAATGWRLETYGACRGDVCMPYPPGLSLRRSDPADDQVVVDVGAAAEHLGLPMARWSSGGRAAIALGVAPSDRGAPATGSGAPGFTLPTLTGEPFTIQGADDLAATATRDRKRLLLAFASW